MRSHLHPGLSDILNLVQHIAMRVISVREEGAPWLKHEIDHRAQISPSRVRMRGIIDHRAWIWPSCVRTRGIIDHRARSLLSHV